VSIVYFAISHVCVVGIYPDEYERRGSVRIRAVVKPDAHTARLSENSFEDFSREVAAFRC